MFDIGIVQRLQRLNIHDLQSCNKIQGKPTLSSISPLMRSLYLLTKGWKIQLLDRKSRVYMLPSASLSYCFYHTWHHHWSACPRLRREPRSWHWWQMDSRQLLSPDARPRSHPCQKQSSGRFHHPVWNAQTRTRWGTSHPTYKSRILKSFQGPFRMNENALICGR